MMAVHFRRSWVVTTALLLSWLLAVRWALPRLIEAMYEGRSLPFFNRVITGQSGNPLSYYTAKAEYLFWLGLPALGLVAYAVRLAERNVSLRRSIPAAWLNYWFRATPTAYLGAARIACVGTVLLLMLPDLSGRFETVRSLASLPNSLYEPILLIRLLFLPFGAGFRPSAEMVEVVQWVTLGTGVLALIGFRTNVALALFALGNVVLVGYSYSFRDIHHPEAIMAIGLWLLAFSPSGRSGSIDALLARRRRGDGIPASPNVSVYAAWPLLLLQCLVAIVYLDSGLQKLWFSGPQWMNGTTLEYYIVKDGLNRGSELASFVLQQKTMIWLLSVITILFEATFWIVLLVPRLAWIYLPVGLLFHLGNALLNIAGFYEFMALYMVFAPCLTGVWRESPLSLWRRSLVHVPGSPPIAPAHVVSSGRAPAT